MEPQNPRASSSVLKHLLKIPIAPVFPHAFELRHPLQDSVPSAQLVPGRRCAFLHSFGVWFKRKENAPRFQRSGSAFVLTYLLLEVV